MAVTKKDIVARILRGRPCRSAAEGTAYAPANIALCKYWGKRNDELNLPVTSSLSVSLGKLGSRARFVLGGERDTVTLNGQAIDSDLPFAQRLFAFLDLFRPAPDAKFQVTAENTILTAAGFASSASGFAAVVMALDKLFGWQLDQRSLSILARLGSGSASRSVYTGFVEWHAGVAEDGMDSYAEPLTETWPELRMGLLVISGVEKPIGSRAAMKRTVETSPLYAAWPAKVAADLVELKTAIRAKDFEKLGRVAESNALAMHATMIAAWPSVVYWLPETVNEMRRVAGLRQKGIPVYLTMDAGPNIKLLFLEKDTEAVQRAFPKVQIIAPFS